MAPIYGSCSAELRRVQGFTNVEPQSLNLDKDANTQCSKIMSLFYKRLVYFNERLSLSKVISLIAKN